MRSVAIKTHKTHKTIYLEKRLAGKIKEILDNDPVVCWWMPLHFNNRNEDVYVVNLSPRASSDEIKEFEARIMELESL